VVRPILNAYLALRAVTHVARRVFFAQPLFRAYCTRCGRNLRTGIYLHWVEGRGRILLGDDVTLDGKLSISFASRFSDSPTLEVGDRSLLSHDCTLTIADRVTIGRDCLIAGGVMILDSSGHPLNPDRRRAKLPPDPHQVRPVTIGDNVWIGSRAIILPGTTIGDDCVVAAGSVLRGSIPDGSLVGGNPAQVVRNLRGDNPSAAGTGRTALRSPK
jgi:acetyltransferase-like isoleucine patch superfamily enzyme